MFNMFHTLDKFQLEQKLDKITKERDDVLAKFEKRALTMTAWFDTIANKIGKMRITFQAGPVFSIKGKYYDVYNRLKKIYSQEKNIKHRDLKLFDPVVLLRNDEYEKRNEFIKTMLKSIDTGANLKEKKQDEIPDSLSKLQSTTTNDAEKILIEEKNKLLQKIDDIRFILSYIIANILTTFPETKNIYKTPSDPVEKIIYNRVNNIIYNIINEKYINEKKELLKKYKSVVEKINPLSNTYNEKYNTKEKVIEILEGDECTDIYNLKENFKKDVTKIINQSTQAKYKYLKYKTKYLELI